MPLVARTKREAEIPSSSLADIAFLLLVFFLVCTVIDTDTGIVIVLPELDDIPIPPKNITSVLINDAQAIMLDGSEVNIRELRQEIVSLITANPKLIISVQTTSKAQYETYMGVLDQLKLAGATRISIAEPVNAAG